MTPTTFTFAPGLNLRVIDRDGQPWFVAKDLCAPLGLRVDNSVRNLEPVEVANTPLEGFARGATLVSESGMYALVMRSRKPSATAFRRWITSEVLPAIRKTGSYTVPQMAGATGHGSPRGAMANFVCAWPGGQAR